MTDKRKEQDYLVTFSDLRMVLRESKRKIIIGGMICACLLALMTLSKPPRYTGEGTFREKSKGDGADSKSLTNLLTGGGGSSAESAALSSMRSRKVIQIPVQELGLQATIKPFSPYPKIVTKAYDVLRNIKDNLKIEYALLRDRPRPSIAYKRDDIKVRHIQYNQEIPTELYLTMLNQKDFVINNPETKFSARGTFGETFREGDTTFVVDANTDENLEGKKYIVAISPLHQVAESISKNIVVEFDRTDKGLIKLRYDHPDRETATNVINGVMQGYRQHLLQEHQKQSQQQIAYLQKRQKEMGSKLKWLLEEHAGNLSSTNNNIEFLISTNQSYKKKLLAIELESLHLVKALEEGSSYFERHTAEGEYQGNLHQILSEIRKLRQQNDSIQLALRGFNHEDNPIASAQFDEQMQSMHEIKQYEEEIRYLQVAIVEEMLPIEQLSILSNPKYLVNSWYQKTLQAYEDYRKCESNEKLTKQIEWESCRNHFKEYLSNLQHVLQVLERTMRERLTHQQNPFQEFEGISLETAQQLYVSHSKESSELEAQRAQILFVIEKLDDPNFEISSLSSILQDPVSKEMVAHASSLVLAIKDENNRTNRELERLKQELALQRGFLTMHLRQTVQLLTLKEAVIKEKISSLQSITQELIRQQITILENHLLDYAKSRLESLAHERSVIEQHQSDIQREMASTPGIWASQKLVDQEMEINKRIVQDIASLVESKNISGNIELNQSGPFDLAVTPVYPKSPYLFLFAGLGGFLGSLLTLGYAFTQTVSNGVRATLDNISLSGGFTLGKLSRRFVPGKTEEINDQDLEILRRLINHHSVPNGTVKMLLVENNCPDYSMDLARLLRLQGISAVVVPLNFDEDSSPGLLQYLEGSLTSLPPIENINGVPRVVSGGVSRFAAELTGSQKFKDYIEELSKSYRWVIGVTRSSASGAEAEALLTVFDNVAVTFKGERLNQLYPYLTDLRASFLEG
jgi:hypothetical protein